ncbi:YdcF family protein [Butyrivibrio sp. VCD2006]|uniref:YdcF family protein n=1 Tax=Butyrivibrio sp. VCD2006 TaxID=1280664 RepID=UPI0004097D72|nr:YdcF family protein [Butyrivibrio sp. VCD2006]
MDLYSGNKTGNDQIKPANAASFDEIGRFIFVSDEPREADLILIPGAPVKELAEHGAYLWKKGYAKKVLVTGKFYMTYESLEDEFNKFSASSGDRGNSKTEAEFLSKLMISEGVDRDSIILEEESTNTFENAKFSREIIEKELKGENIKRIILCCQAFHARRALMTFQSELRDIEIIVCPVVTRGLSIDTWMDNLKNFNLVLSELSKCGEYFMGERMYELR